MKPHSSNSKGGRIALAAVMLCKDPEFLLYLDRRSRAKFNQNTPDGTHTENTAKLWLCAACEITSRAELDHNAQAAQRFFYIRNRYQKYRRERGNF